MTSIQKALLLGALQAALVASLGVKLLADRATRPRFWLKTAPVDPDGPLRGRYVEIQAEIPAPTESLDATERWRGGEIQFEVGPQGLTARLLKQPTSPARSLRGFLRKNTEGALVVVTEKPLAFFIPEHVADPSRRPAGEELWVEATLPRKGPLRPLRLGIKKDGVVTPLSL